MSDSVPTTNPSLDIRTPDFRVALSDFKLFEGGDGLYWTFAGDTSSLSDEPYSAYGADASSLNQILQLVPAYAYCLYTEPKNDRHADHLAPSAYSRILDGEIKTPFGIPISPSSSLHDIQFSSTT